MRKLSGFDGVSLLEFFDVHSEFVVDGDRIRLKGQQQQQTGDVQDSPANNDATPVAANPALTLVEEEEEDVTPSPVPANPVLTLVEEEEEDVTPSPVLANTSSIQEAEEDDDESMDTEEEEEEEETVEGRGNEEEDEPPSRTMCGCVDAKQNQPHFLACCPAKLAKAAKPGKDGVCLNLPY